MLGKTPAALFLLVAPGKPLALKIYSERSRRSAVALHPNFALNTA